MHTKLTFEVFSVLAKVNIKIDREFGTACNYHIR